MSKKTYTLVSAVTGGVAAIASAVVAYVQPAYTVPIVASIGIASTAIIDIAGQFVKAE